jgi:phosphoglucosamine mutase
MPKLFGTDGIRGVANSELTAELAMRVGRSAAAALASTSPRPRVVVGRDTRISGDLLESALIAGLLSAGVDVLKAGILPTPAIAFLVTDLRADAGAVISASHNPAEDNGIKFFGGDGFKISEAQEEEIEALLDGPSELPSGGDIGRIHKIANAEDRYLAHALRALEGRRLEAMKVVIDCAHGAAYRTSPRALAEAGAEVMVLNAKPDGLNINVGCGSTAPEMLSKAVVEHDAHAGLAHDGDADRVIAVDERGEVVDGDGMIAALALELKEQDRLAGDIVVVTVMANLGLRHALAEAGVKMAEVPVGDRFVFEAMLNHGAVIGGEQSGHIVFSEYANTGDGLITGLRLLGLMASSGKPLSELVKVARYPQVLLSVRVPDATRLSEAEALWELVSDVEDRLGKGGRVLVRASGTEPMVRVMVEASDDAIALEAATEIADAVRQELGGGARS